MALPNTFANETSPGMVELDQNFAAIANMAMWNATATGTNTIALTTTANQPAVSAYTDRQRFFFTAPANSTGSVTAAVNALAALPVYLPSGTQAASGDITSGAPYTVVYLAALNGGGGGFAILSAIPASGVAPVVLGSTRGIVVANNSSTPNTKIDITAGQALLVTTGGSPKFIASPAVTIDLTTTGANGMDTGARPTSGFVYCYLISNGSITAGLASATSPSAGNPTFPGGYSYYTYVGSMYCDGSQNLMRTRQTGPNAQYTVVGSTNTAKLPVIGNGVVGTFSTTSPVLVAVTVRGNAAFVPLTANSIIIDGLFSYQAGTASLYLIAPSAAYGGTNNGPSGSNGLAWPIAGITNAGNAITVQGTILLESDSVYWCSGAAGGAIACQGWYDSWVR